MGFNNLVSASRKPLLHCRHQPVLVLRAVVAVLGIVR